MRGGPGSRARSRTRTASARGPRARWAAGGRAVRGRSGGGARGGGACGWGGPAGGAEGVARRGPGRGAGVPVGGRVARPRAAWRPVTAGTGRSRGPGPRGRPELPGFGAGRGATGHPATCGHPARERRDASAAASPTVAVRPDRRSAAPRAALPSARAPGSARRRSLSGDLRRGSRVLGREAPRFVSAALPASARRRTCVGVPLCPYVPSCYGPGLPRTDRGLR